MILRYKNSKKKIVDIFVFVDEVDYWADTAKMQVIMEINGKQLIIGRTKVYQKLQKGIDKIHDVIENDPNGFLDTTKLFE